MGSAKEHMLERQQAEHDAKVAAEWGLSPDELNSVEWRIDDEETDQGTPYRTLYIEKGADPDIIRRIEAKVGKLDDSGSELWCRVGW